MHKRIYYIVNGITLCRMIAAPILLLLIINHQPETFKWLLAVSFLTDVIDGHLARRYKVISILGAKLDSVADDLTVIMAIIGMIVFKPEFFRQEIILFIILLALFVLQTAFAVARYGKISSFHTYAAKTAAVLQGIFLLLLFFVDKPVYILFYITIAVTAIELVEEIILVCMLPQWKTDVKGLYWVIRHRQLKQ
jgi:phosphatidylglycerophosphate synthase